LKAKSLALALASKAKSLALALEAKSLALALRVVALTPSLLLLHHNMHRTDVSLVQLSYMYLSCQI